MMKNLHLRLLLGSYIKSNHKTQDALNYFWSYYRYYIYYSNHFGWLMRKHIRQQVDFRIAVMNQTCYNQGSCIHCGCATTALQMSNRVCHGEEYPPMLKKEEWLLFRKGKTKVINNLTGTNWLMVITKHTSIMIIENRGARLQTREIEIA